jgi:predicted ArsR family transcriptional regulator
MLGGWVSVAAFARQSGVFPRTMLRRLKALEHMSGVRLLRSKHQAGRKPRKWWVHPERAQAALEKDPDARTASIEDLFGRVERLEQIITVLKKAQKSANAQRNSAVSL